MLSKNVLSSVCAVTLLACVSASPAIAQTPIDKRVYFTFSGPFSLPGVTLKAGSYLFRLADPLTSRSVVQVLSADGTKIYGTFFAIPARRPVVSEKPEVRFMETPASMPHAIRTWWYPSESTGFEFIYPKEQARRLAQGSGQSVLTTQAQTKTSAETETDKLTRISSTGQETNVDLKVPAESLIPTGETTSGEKAPPSLVIPSKPVPVPEDE
jgi:hypothetical protein